MAFSTITGRSQLIGWGNPVAFPITLDVAVYEGAVVYADNGNVYYSDGTTWTAIGTSSAGIQGATGIQGTQGLQGDYGPGFTIIGSVADVDAGGDPQATLNAAFGSANVGDGVIDEADDELWIYVGSSTWVNIGNFRGVQGFQGPIGFQGIQGPLGNEGIQGERGFRGFQGEAGPQGTQGIQGNLGIQGIQGRRGPQGVQGVQGLQGIQGPRNFQGTQGPQGTTGIQGDTGIQGLQGFTGSYGGVSFEYDFDTSTSIADPGQSNFRFNDALASQAARIAIDSIAKNLGDISEVFDSIDDVEGSIKGYLQITQISDIQKFITYEIVDIIDNGGWIDLQVNYLTATATVGNLTSSPACIISLTRVGDQGIQGVQGITGIQGLQGLQGRIGPQGVQGLQGITGSQGSQGTQGLLGPQGIQGPQGLQGLQGPQGLQGSTGDFGGISYDYDYDATAADADPGIGKLRFSSTNFASANLKLWIDDEDKGSVAVMDGVATELSNLTGSPKGYVRFTNKTNVYDQFLARIDDITDKTGYWEFAITRLNGVTAMTDNTNLNVTFSRNGDRGLQGIQGVQGVQGLQGRSGPQGIQGLQGLQGDTGIQGIQGVQGESIQGTQGVQGTTGIQGLQGLQGLTGATGAQGVQGLQGITGIQGLQGLQGEQGQYGGLTFIWNFVNNTLGGTDPGTNNFKFNNSNPTLATLITIDDIPADQYSQEVDDFFDFIAGQPGTVKGYLKIQEGNYDDGNGPAGHHWLVYEITGWTWDSGSKNYGYWDVNYVDGNVTNWQTAVNAVHGPATLITFIPRGPAGIQGAQGIQGVQGLQGRTGAGIQGAQGPQGTLGTQGTTGSFGGVTFDYTFDSSTVNGDPGTGKLRINNTTLSSGTAMFIDNRDDNFIDISTFLATIDDSTSPIKGHFKITKVGSPEIFHLYTISSATPIGGYFNVACSHVDGNGTLSNNDDITITFARTGDAGATGATGPQGIQGVQGVQGNDGIQGSTGAGAQGATGADGPQGTQGLQGPIGAGATGAQGIQGIQGIQGNDGFQGLQGADGTGAAGAQGASGIQGIQGLQGTAGQDGAQGQAGTGAQGIQGLQGIGGTGADGFQGTQGVQGIQGNDGGQGIQGADGGEGQPGGPGAQGAAGPQGIQGFQGLQGPGGVGADGFQGPQGVQGPQGFQGLLGAQGPGGTGPQGTQGPAGAQGQAGTGTQGIQGDLGIQGIQGIDGAVGVGTPGPQGIQGIQGAFGPQGDTGAGIQGPIGIQGNQGTVGAGSPGPQGPQGDLGIQGPQGPIGFQGTIGATSAQGATGIQGNQGTQGPDGGGGLQGIQGIIGTQGPQGLDGSGGGDGPQGPAGPQGYVGIQGPSGQGTLGPQGPAGIQGLVGAGGQGPAGPQGEAGSAVGPQGSAGFQGADGAGVQGPQGIVGGIGPQGTTGTSGPQGTRGFQGIQGGAGSNSGLDVASLHTSGLQGTAMFITMVQGGSGVRPLYGTTTPNPGGEQNFFYTANDDELTLENIKIDGSATLNGSTITSWPTGGGSTNAFGTVAVSGQSNVIADQAPDTLTLIAGSNMTITTNATNDSITFNASTSGGTQNLFETISVSGQTSVQADSSTDTLTFVAGTNMTITTDATTDSITFNSTGGGGGGLANIVEDTTPQLGGNLDGQSYNITTTGDITAANFNTTSDESLKENVETIENALSKVINMRGVNFNWKENAQPGTGVIAQEMEQVIPQVITENDEGIKHVQYGNLVGTLIEAIKEQQNQIEELKVIAHPPRGLDELEGGQELFELLRDIEARLDKLEG